MKQTSIAFIIGLLLIGGFFLLFKQNQPITKPTNKLQVVTSFYPMYFFASEIAGDKADLINITPASVEPHDYEPSTKDIAQIDRANILVLHGGALESWGDKIRNNLQGKQITIVVAGNNLTTHGLDEKEKNIKDPHMWLDPILAKQEVWNIEKGLEKADPSDKAYFENNTKNLEDKLDQIDMAYKNGLQNCKRREFVTSHAAFGYMAARYHLEQTAISGLSPDEEPSTQKLAHIVDIVKQKGIKVIFFESLISPKLSETIANESHAKTMVLDPIEGISDDDLKAGHTYLTVMQENLDALQTALECTK